MNPKQVIIDYASKHYSPHKESIKDYLSKNEIPASFLDPKKNYQPKCFDFCRVFIFLKENDLNLSFISNLYIIGGKINIDSFMSLKLVMDTKLVEKFEEFFIDEASQKICIQNKNLLAEPQGAYCLIKRKNMPEVFKIFTLANAKKAGLLGRGIGWSKYPSDMLVHKARIRALRSAFPDIMAELNIKDDREDTDPVIEDEGVERTTFEEEMDTPEPKPEPKPEPAPEPTPEPTPEPAPEPAPETQFEIDLGRIASMNKEQRIEEAVGLLNLCLNYQLTTKEKIKPYTKEWLGQNYPVNCQAIINHCTQKLTQTKKFKIKS